MQLSVPTVSELHSSSGISDSHNPASLEVVRVCVSGEGGHVIVWSE